jgi:TolB-like protein/Flp pilus assembly protein TadD
LPYFFDSYALDPDRRELRKEGVLQALEPQVFDLLVYLIVNRDRVVSRDDMLAAVWKGRIVSESTLSSRINAARTAIGDDGNQQRLIRTALRKGVRFVGEVLEKAAAPALKEASPFDLSINPANEIVAAPALALPNKPSIAVLPFQNMSGDPEQEYFADGIADEILTALSRFRELFVIARTSSFTYKGKAVDVRQIGRELGVRYVLEGSVRKAGGRIRINGQLVDATNGGQVWADRFEGSHEDIFDLQDHVASAVVNAVAPKIEQVEIARAAAKPTDSLDAYDYFMRASACIYRWSRSDLEEAEVLLARSIELDPKFAMAYASATWCLAWRVVNFWTDDLATDAARCGVLARQAVDLAPDDANVLSIAGYSIAQVGGAFDEGIVLVNRAVSLNPNLARAWFISAVVHIFIGRPETAIEHTERAMRLSPRDIVIHLMMHTKARAHFYCGRLDEAIAWSTRAMRESPLGHEGSILHLAASYALSQRPEEATAAIAKFLAVHPQARLSNIWHLSPIRARQAPDLVAQLKQGLRLAGMPE